MKYNAVVSMAEIGTFTTFKDAFKAIYDKLLELMGQGPLSEVGLFEATWVEEVDANNLRKVRMFAEARDAAVDFGWLVDGKWVA